METSIEVNRHPAPSPQAADELTDFMGTNLSGSPGTGPVQPEEARGRANGIGRDRRVTQSGRQSVDPMRATDRYRLALPGDPRL